MPLVRAVLVTCLVFCVQGVLNTTLAQRYGVRIHDTESGLVGNHVNDMVQDANGIIWVATDNGVSAFDGLSFQNFTVRSGLSEEVCTTLFIDSKNRVWVGHRTGGLSVIQADTVLRFTEEQGLVNNEVHDITEAEDGSIWVATFGGIAVFDGQDWTSITVDNGLVFNYTQALAQAEDGSMWVGTYGAGIQIISDQGTAQLDIERGLANNYVTSIVSHNGHMYIGTLGGVSDWNGNSFTDTFSGRGLASNQVNDLTVDARDRLWLATFNGAVRMDDRTILTIAEQNGLPQNEVLAVLVDNDQNIWFGTKSGLVRMLGLAFSHFESTEDLDLYPTCLFVDSEGTLWAGNETGGVLKLESDGFVNAFEDPDINSHHISAIAEDAEGNLWFGTTDFSGLFQYDGTQFYIYSDEFGLADNNINCLATGTDGLLFIGTPNGLSIFDGTGFSQLFISDNLMTNHITALETGTDGSMYIGSKDGSVHVYRNGDVRKEERIRTSSWITDMVFASDGLCIGTFNDGLWVIQPDTVVHLTIDNGLPTSEVLTVFEHGSRLFIGSSAAVYGLQFIQDRLQVFRLGNEDGYLGGACRPAAVARYGGAYYLGTAKGITRFKPAELIIDNTPPLTRITAIQLAYQPVDWAKKGFAVDANGLPQDLVLPYMENNLSFHFSGIDHHTPEAITYKWKLEGYEKEWTPTSKQPVANYPNLPPGKYTFNVVACNGNGICNPNPVQVHFRIEPPFWQKLWFHIALALTVVLVIYLFMVHRERVLKKEKELLEATVAERTQELRQQKEIVEHQNRHITESIEYASNIQRAILPSVSEMKRAFTEHFVFYRPKDTVGGDFYWAYSDGNVSWAAAVDCTGHGVAGAFMSMIGTDLLNQIIIEKKIDDPGRVLSEMDKGIKLAFAQSEKEFETDQGMDVALVRIDRERKELRFAGAQRPLFVMEHGELTVIEGNRLCISCAEQRNAEPFETHKMNYTESTILYLFSDGIVDQFGGPKAKKFMIRRLRELIVRIGDLPMEEQCLQVNATFDQWKGKDMEQIDDVMLLGIRP